MSALTQGRIALVMVVTAIALAGCAISAPHSPQQEDQQTMNTDATLESAKSATQAVRDEILALMPAEATSDVRVVDEATLMDCAEGSYAWPGGATVVTTGEWDAEGFLATVLASYENRDGWKVIDQIASDARVDVTAPDGTRVFTSVVKDGGEVWIRAFSTCFPFDPRIGKKY